MTDDKRDRVIAAEGLRDDGGNLTGAGTQQLLHAADDARKRLREEGPPPTQAETDRRQVELIEALLDKHGVANDHVHTYTPYGRLQILFGDWEGIG